MIESCAFLAHFTSTPRQKPRSYMGEVGIEPTRPLRTGDFKSPASAIPPLAQVLVT